MGERGKFGAHRVVYLGGHGNSSTVFIAKILTGTVLRSNTSTGPTFGTQNGKVVLLVQTLMELV